MNEKRLDMQAQLALRNDYQMALQTRKAKPLGSAFIGSLSLLVTIAVMLGSLYVTDIGARAMYNCLEDKGAFDNTFIEYIDFEI